MDTPGPRMAPADALKLVHHLACESSSTPLQPPRRLVVTSPAEFEVVPAVALEGSLLGMVPQQVWCKVVEWVEVVYKVYVSYYFLVAGLLVVIFGFNTLLSTTYLIFVEKSRLVGVTVSLVLTQSYLFSSVASNTLTTVHDVWRTPPNTYLHARRYLAYLLSGLSWLHHRLLFHWPLEGGFRRYTRDEVYQQLRTLHLTIAFGIPMLAGVVGFLASGVVVGATYFTFAATMAALLLLAVRFFCVWVEGVAEKFLWVRFAILRLAGHRQALPPTDAPLHCFADYLEHALAAFGLDPRSMMLSAGFLSLLFCLVAAYAELYANREYQQLSDTFLFYAAGTLIIWLFHAWQPQHWPTLLSVLLRCHSDVDPDFEVAVHLVTATCFSLAAYVVWLYLTLTTIGSHEPAYWGFILCLGLVQGFFTRKVHKRRRADSVTDPLVWDVSRRQNYDTIQSLLSASPISGSSSRQQRMASPALTGSDVGMVTGQPQTTLLLFVSAFLLLSVGMISVGQQIALPRYGPQLVAATAPHPVIPDPGRAQYPVCFYRWLQNRFTIVDFAFLSQLAYFSPENFRRNVELWYPAMSLNISSSEQETTAIHQATFYDVHDLETDSSIIVVRGTIDALDLLQDARIWGDSGLLAVFGVLGPFVSVWSLEQTTLYIRLSAVFSRYLRTRSVNYMYDLEHYVRNIVPLRREVILTGHSLGGGLAKLVSAKLRVWSVTFSSPGIVWARVAEDTNIRLDDVDTYTMTVVPRGDFLSGVDREGGQVVYIDCPKSVRGRDLTGCHYISSTICTLLRRCGDPDPLSPHWGQRPLFRNRTFLGCWLPTFAEAVPRRPP
eukprot:GGOE01050015.1.p1 GENE.GGOE01050015.1~~GGOE01050015.1.p1  ORF type:complete len:846 (+),score=285.88 GGOE01050015.1:45-2540(+)